MDIDSSAIIAILLVEVEAETFANAIALDDVRICSAVSFLEACIVIETRRGAAGLTRLDLLIAEAHIEVAPFSLRDARVPAVWKRHPSCRPELRRSCVVRLSTRNR
jgi:ribonuclease VapC